MGRRQKRGAALAVARSDTGAFGQQFADGGRIALPGRRDQRLILRRTGLAVRGGGANKKGGAKRRP
jgi:hypothetical protein